MSQCAVTGGLVDKTDHDMLALLMLSAILYNNIIFIL